MCDVAVTGETITAIEPVGTLTDAARKEVDARGCFVIPGGVDPHCHYNLDNWGKFRTENQDYSAAAAFGGTTTVVDFATQKDPDNVADSIRAKRLEADGRMAVDYALHLILKGNPSVATIEQLGDAIRSGVPTIKTFTCYEDECDDGHRWGVMVEVAKNRGMSLVHAEDDSLIRWFTEEYRRAGKTHGAYVPEVRNSLVEELPSGAQCCSPNEPALPCTLSTWLPQAVWMLSRKDAREVCLSMLRHSPLIYRLHPLTCGMIDRRSLMAGNMDHVVCCLTTSHHRNRKWIAKPCGLPSQIIEFRRSAVTTQRLALRIGTKSRGRLSIQCKRGRPVRDTHTVLFHLGVSSGRISVNRFVELVSTAPAKLRAFTPEGNDCGRQRR